MDMIYKMNKIPAARRCRINQPLDSATPLRYALNDGKVLFRAKTAK